MLWGIAVGDPELRKCQQSRVCTYTESITKYETACISTLAMCVDSLSIGQDFRREMRSSDLLGLRNLEDGEG